ncbi:hypothetical protein KFE25_002571 [Diacronema lutheri]|uniref:Peptidase M48 domain-containing protein n=1 Tax=Diacronema lutheri TaxID=2081491 RepID=A0A8J6CA79_DIALT|nr:hypothetical protein KFE25_002571 [Diacronema lutheri]
MAGLRAATLVVLVAHCHALRVDTSPLARRAATKPGIRRAAVHCSTAGAARAPSRGRVRFPTLAARDFQHSEDAAATASLRSFWPIESAIRTLILPVIEEATFLDNIASGVLVGPDQLPSLHAALVEACAILGVGDKVDLYVKNNPFPNAYTLAIDGRRPFIVVHSALLDLLTPEETQAVLAHELGHIKCEHGLWITVANVLALAADAFSPRAGAAVSAALLRWRRAAELSCDRAALLVSQDPTIALSVIVKLTGGSVSLRGELSVDAFLRQVQRFDQSAATRVGSALSNSQTAALTHPLPILRAAELNRWASGEQYRALVSSAKRRQAALG